MPFRFPLEAVFHFRQSVEHQHELRLRAANQQVARVRHLVEVVDERIRQEQLSHSRQIGAGTTAAEMHFALMSEASLRQHRQDLDRELLRLQNLRDQQQKVFEQAHRERETFESLRTHQYREHERDVTRREQRRLDDLFLLRQAYLRRG